VVALALGGTPEVVEHGRSGRLARPGDTRRFAENMIDLLGDPDLRERMGRYGRRQVEERFSTERMAEDVARVYRLVLSMGRGGSGDLQGAGHAGHIS
jgi:glycosyltransferase involved in cell wall biosynthesis